MVAAIHEVDGYDRESVIAGLSKDPAVLAIAADEFAFAVQEVEPDASSLVIAVQFWNLLLNSDRSKVPAQALTGLGRWAFVDNIDDDQWAELTARTLDITDGQINNAVFVADRAGRTPPNSTKRNILLRLVDANKTWERHRAATKAIEVLRASTTQPTDDSFRRLRTRLIDLGHHEASTIRPPDACD